MIEIAIVINYFSLQKLIIILVKSNYLMLFYLVITLFYFFNCCFILQFLASISLIFITFFIINFCTFFKIILFFNYYMDYKISHL